jgi:DNA modification methylase
MELVTKNTSDLIPYVNNSRTHSEEQVNQIISSIKEFGFTNPILIEQDNGIIAGHGRIMAAKKMGLKEVPCVIVKGLTKTQIKALNIADNQIALNAGWDLEKLKLEIQGLNEDEFNLDTLGFTKNQIDDFLFEETVGLTDEDEVPDVKPEDIKSKLGDIWILGNHRIICGDSTIQENVDKVLNGNSIDMVFTDPPYNIDYKGVKDDRKIMNDKMDDDSFVDFLTTSLIGCETMYVCCSWQYAHLFREAMIKIARKPKAMIIWDKINPAQHLDKYFKQHEIIYYYGDFGGQKTLRGDVWSLKRKKNTLHPTMKPVELITIALDDQKEKKNIYDGFLGSGSTLIACEKLKRTCYGMELDPKYIDVIIERWQNFTGKEAIHEQTGKRYNEI